MKESKNRMSVRRLGLRVWQTLSGQDRSRLKLAAVVMLAGSGLVALLPLLIGALVNQSLSNGAFSISASARNLSMIGILVILAQLLDVVRRQLVEAVATGFERDVRQTSYFHLLRLDLESLRGDQVGRVYGRANRSMEGAVRLLKLGALDLVPAATLAALALMVAFFKAPIVAMAMLMVIPTGFGLVWWQVSSQAGVRLRLRDRKEDIDGQVTELLPALEVVRTSGAESFFISRIEDACGALRTTELGHHRAMSLFDAAKALNEGFWLVVTLTVAVTVSSGGPQGAGEVTAIILLYAGVTAPLRDLHRIVDEGSESAQQTQDLFDLLDQPEDESYVDSPVVNASDAKPNTAIAVSMSGVSFDYGTGEPGGVLRDFDMSVAAGERIGIVGPSGCGKSTLLRLACRLLHTDTGSVQIGGESIQSLNRDAITAMVGYVPQAPQVFRMTVMENILLGSPEAVESDAVRAATRAHLHEEIMRLPDGYSTLVSERGETLSGGQRQRLCIARALVSTPSILLLDEATSALDEEAQSAVTAAIDSLEGVTLIVVAHRRSTLSTMDRILVMNGGRVTKELSFEQLAALQMPEIKRSEVETEILAT